eukprot:s5267_g1.t1
MYSPSCFSQLSITARSCSLCTEWMWVCALFVCSRAQSPSSPGLPSILARSTSNASRDSKNALRPALPSHRSMLYSRSRSRSWSAGLGRRHSDGSLFFDPSLTLTYSALALLDVGAWGTQEGRKSVPPIALPQPPHQDPDGRECLSDRRGAEDPDASDLPKKAGGLSATSKKRALKLLHEIQGRWVLKSEKQCDNVADWLKTFEIHGLNVLSSNGTQQRLELCEDLKVALCGGDMKLDTKGFLHRHGRSGQHLEFDDFEFEEDSDGEAPLEHIASVLGASSP